MSIAIRLARGGSKKRPYYRIVVADSRAPRDGRFIEKVGTYNPLLAKDSPERVKLLGERISHWLSVGAQPSDNVAVLIKKYGTNGTHEAAQKAALDKISAPKSVPDPGTPASLPKPKKTKEEIAAEAAAAEAAANPPAEEAPAAEAPAAEAPVEAAAEG